MVTKKHTERKTHFKKNHYSKENLISLLRAFALKLGKTPTKQQLNDDISMTSETPFRRVWAGVCLFIKTKSSKCSKWQIYFRT